MSSASRLLATLLVAACLAAVAAASARADGDPASDYLLSQNVFVPFDGKIPTAAAGELTQLAHDAAARGYPIRVALITSRYDLGAVTALWRQPQRYAQFLGEELYFVYRGRLLVVMPNGYGVSRGGKPVPAMSKALAGLAPPAAGGAAFVTSAELAVRRLARADGVELAIGPARATGGHSATRDRILIGVAVFAVAALLGTIALVRGRRRAA